MNNQSEKLSGGNFGQFENHMIELFYKNWRGHFRKKKRLCGKTKVSAIAKKRSKKQVKNNEE